MDRRDVRLHRRDFLALAGAAGTAAAWPLAARAQQTRMPVIGWLSGGNEIAFGVQLEAYRRALGEAGLVEGKTVQIEWRWEDGDNSKAQPFMNDLIQRHVDVLSLTGGWNGGQQIAIGPIYQSLFISRIPAVTAVGRDARIDGLVADLAHPERNLTCVNNQTQELEPKRLNLLHDVMPAARTIGYLAQPANAITPDLMQEAQQAAQTLGMHLVVFSANTVAEIDAVSASLKATPVDALIVSAVPFFNTNREQVTRLVTQAGVPAIAEWKEFAEDGALLGYGTSLDATFHQIGEYTAALLKGAKVADLPVVQNETYDFAINLKAAKAMGLTVPPSMLAIATEVIE